MSVSRDRQALYKKNAGNVFIQATEFFSDLEMDQSS